MHETSRWYRAVYIHWLVASYDTHKGKRWLTLGRVRTAKRHLAMSALHTQLLCCIGCAYLVSWLYWLCVLGSHLAVSAVHTQSLICIGGEFTVTWLYRLRVHSYLAVSVCVLSHSAVRCAYLVTRLYRRAYSVTWLYRCAYFPVKNYRHGADNLYAFMADRGDDGREIGDAAACPMSRS